MVVARRVSLLLSIAGVLVVGVAVGVHGRRHGGQGVVLLGVADLGLGTVVVGLVQVGLLVGLPGLLVLRGLL